MSRAPIILVIVVVLIVAAFVWLSWRPAAIAPHHIEKTVTLGGSSGGNADGGGAGDGAAH